MIWFGKFPGAKPNTYPTTGASQNTSLHHPIGSSDGRCVQRAGSCRNPSDNAETSKAKKVHNSNNDEETATENSVKVADRKRLTYADMAKLGVAERAAGSSSDATTVVNDAAQLTTLPTTPARFQARTNRALLALVPPAPPALVCRLGTY
ncbi:hypothetical protein T01_16078 [Trichinella spiralis]|uniref:Uncharacterized protein n=1 Tax=Trichinella spiralis TaxID=6334 RepID=A0A0V1BQ25_TRISP|nr:hypothetical protein T01_16078 [Trichinella spiralis]